MKFPNDRFTFTCTEKEIKTILSLSFNQISIKVWLVPMYIVDDMHNMSLPELSQIEKRKSTNDYFSLGFIANIRNV